MANSSFHRHLLRFVRLLELLLLPFQTDQEQQRLSCPINKALGNLLVKTEIQISSSSLHAITWAEVKKAGDAMRSKLELEACQRKALNGITRLSRKASTEALPELKARFKVKETGYEGGSWLIQITISLFVLHAYLHRDLI